MAVSWQLWKDSSLLPQICEFVASKGRVEPELDDPHIKAVLTDITCHLNTVYLQFQGKDKTLGIMLHVVKAFQNKITTLFIPDSLFISPNSAQSQHPTQT
jgi:hypothetical protein